jgi:colanic acid biosynthesis glycosyl transferase WcaI
VRVTLLNQFYAPDISPTAQLAASLAEHRAELGDDVTVLTGRAGYLEGLGPAGPAGVGGDATGVRVRRTWTPDLGRASVARRLLGYVSYLLGTTVRVLLLPAQDVIVAMTTPPFVVLLALAHKVLHRRTRVVLWSMDCCPDAAERFEELRPGGFVSRLLRAVNRAAFRRLDHVVALDGAMAALLAQYQAAPGRPPTSVVPNWERAALFPAGEVPDPWPGWDELAVEGRTVVVYLGNLGVGHQFDTVVDAAAALGDDALFVFIGGGARRDELAAAVEARRLSNVVLQEYVPKEETAAVMAGADAALITLDERSLGIMSPSKLHANLAAGLPVLYVGPEGSNVDEAIARFGCGASLRDGDVDGLVAAVRRLRTDDAADLRARARAAFDAAYNDRVTLPQLDAILEGRAGAAPLSVPAAP